MSRASNQLAAISSRSASDGGALPALRWIHSAIGQPARGLGDLGEFAARQRTAEEAADLARREAQILDGHHDAAAFDDGRRHVEALGQVAARQGDVQVRRRVAHQPVDDGDRLGVEAVHLVEGQQAGRGVHLNAVRDQPQAVVAALEIAARRARGENLEPGGGERERQVGGQRMRVVVVVETEPGGDATGGRARAGRPRRGTWTCRSRRVRGNAVSRRCIGSPKASRAGRSTKPSGASGTMTFWRRSHAGVVPLPFPGLPPCAFDDRSWIVFATTQSTDLSAVHRARPVGHRLPAGRRVRTLAGAPPGCRHATREERRILELPERPAASRVGNRGDDCGTVASSQNKRPALPTATTGRDLIAAPRRVQAKSRTGIRVKADPWYVVH